MSKVDDKSASASSEPSSGSNAVTDDEIAAWKAMFASSNPKREEGVLDKYNFIAVVLKVMAAMAKTRGADAVNRPTIVDLDAAFKLADEDKSGNVDLQEFVQLMKLVSAGKVTGLGKPGWFQKDTLEKKFKGDLASEAATGAQDAAAAAAKDAAELEAKSKEAAAEVAAAKAAADKAAAAKAKSAKTKAGAASAASKDETDEMFWRQMFALDAGSKAFLNKAQFDSVVKKLSLRMTATSDSDGSVPDSKDLDAAFVVADDDLSGGVDEEEFVAMMKVIKAGGAEGLSTSGSFSALSEQSAKFKAALKEAKEAAAAKKAKDTEAVNKKAAAGDKVAKAEAEALALAAAAKEASERNKAAEKVAAKAAAKAAKAKGESSSGVIDVTELKARFAKSDAVREKGALDRPAFIHLVSKVLAEDEGADENSKPTQEDLDAAFTLADDDKSGDVDQQEFVQIMKLISAGKVTGLGRPGWFQKAALEEKYKTDLATEAAAEAQEAAAAAAKEAAELAEKSKEAAANVEAAKAAANKDKKSKKKAKAPPAVSEEAANEKSWRESFKNEAGQEGILNKAQFDSAMKNLSSKSTVPDSKDLDAAFVVAGEDKSGGVDEEEFVAMMTVINAGGAEGLGDGDMFSVSSEKSAKFKAALKEAEEAAAAKKAKELKAAFEKGAAGDEVAKAEAEALALEISAKDAAKRSKAAGKEAAEAAAKVANLKGETSPVLGAEAVSTNEQASMESTELKEAANEVVVPESKPQEIPDEESTTEIAPPAPPQESNHDRVLIRIYEAEDGFRGSYDEVVAHEEMLNLAKGSEHEVGMQDASRREQVLLRIYEAPDGFRGTYDEVVAHEEKLGLGKGNEIEADQNDRDIMHLYKAKDGFYGTYDEVLAYEKMRGYETSDEKETMELYEAPDGFRGTYEEILAHEEKLGYKFCEETGAIKPHSNDVAPVKSVLNAEGVGLGQYVEPFHLNGVNFATELSGCTDAWLADKVGLTTAEHLTKFRELVPDNTADLPATASDGFKGTTSDVAMHEVKLRQLIDVQPTAIKAQSAPVIQPNHDRVLMRVYEAEDGFRGSYDEVVAHEEKMHLIKGNEHEVGPQEVFQHEKVLLRIYEAPDGFRGTYDEVVAHEEKLGLGKGNEVEADQNDHVVMHLYEAADGFRGTYNEVLIHENALGIDVGNETEVNGLYEAPDGFRGTYDEVVAHEEKLGYKFCEETGTIKPHSDEVASAESVLNADGVDLGKYVEPLHQNGVNFATELSGCTDAWLADKVGLTSSADLTKFRELVPDNTADLSATASDGFKGTTSDVAMHEVKLRELIDVQPAAKTATPAPSIEAHHDRILLRIYEADDGFRGTYDEVVAHEEKLNLAKGSEHEVDAKDVSQREKVLLRIYEAPDGFRGTYDEVEAHEQKLAASQDQP